MEKIVFLGLVICCRRAIMPTNLSPLLVNATTEGMVLPPSLLSMIFGSPAWTAAIAEKVVPRSIPNIFGI
ncbi:MAG: hypothetical protein DDT40_01914 [candidate division WS2 bacterium]|nr:hypothetical protein [Candidatus Psychracetigena formicireducens]